MQPVQDITVEDRVSRTQFQYTLEDPNADELNAFAPTHAGETAAVYPCCAMWPATRRSAGCATPLVFDRNTAYRLGISPSTIDQTLYDAYGQREVSTIYTQLNQYHVVLEVNPTFRRIRWTCAISTSAPTAPMLAGSPGLVAGGSSRPAVRTDQLADGCQHQPFEFRRLLRPLPPRSLLIAPSAATRSLPPRSFPTAVRCR